jgi:hypothetical protein
VKCGLGVERWNFSTPTTKRPEEPHRNFLMYNKKQNCFAAMYRAFLHVGVELFHSSTPRRLW